MRKHRFIEKIGMSIRKRWEVKFGMPCTVFADQRQESHADGLVIDIGNASLRRHVFLHFAKQHGCSREVMPTRQFEADLEMIDMPEAGKFEPAFEERIEHGSRISHREARATHGNRLP